MFKFLFRKRPFSVQTAASGEEALALIEEHQVQVMLADLSLPGMTGAELLQHVRANPKNDGLKNGLPNWGPMATTVSLHIFQRSKRTSISYFSIRILRLCTGGVRPKFFAMLS